VTGRPDLAGRVVCKHRSLRKPLWLQLLACYHNTHGTGQ
jgi:hypothetical protein